MAQPSMRKSFSAGILFSLLAAPLLATAHDNRDDDWRGDDHHKIQHVFVITLENKGYDETFGAISKAAYLSKTLPSMGVLLTQYYGTTHVSLGNYIAMISGQASNPDTQLDCQTYKDFALTGMTADGQAIGSGCVYPASIKTFPDQLKAVGKTWRAYNEDMGNDPAREAPTCGHPQLNTVDFTQSAEAPSATVPLGDQYAARHNPFVYFHSIIDTPDCDANVVSLNQLKKDLKSESATPNFVFITPNLCNDGHDGPCKNGQPGGLVSADQFLQQWVPQILASAAYKKDGLLIINFDEGELSITQDPATKAISLTAAGEACCSEQAGPNVKYPSVTNLGPYKLAFNGLGGDRTGAVLISPFIKPGKVSNIPFNHYSLLKTLEDIFEVDGYLGYAGQPGLAGFFGCVSSDIEIKTSHQFVRCEKN